MVETLLEVQGEALKPLRLSSVSRASILCCERMSEGVCLRRRRIALSLRLKPEAQPASLRGSGGAVLHPREASPS